MTVSANLRSASVINMSMDQFKLPPLINNVHTIPDIIPEINWLKFVHITNDNVILMLNASHEPLQKAKLDLGLLLSMSEETTMCYESAPKLPFLFRPTGFRPAYNGLGTNNRTIAIHMMLLHMATCIFNNACHLKQPITDKLVVKSYIIPSLYLLMAAEKYRGPSCSNEKTTPPITCIGGKHIFRLIIELMFLSVRDIPTYVSDKEHIENIIRHLGTVYKLLEHIPESLLYKNWKTWKESVSVWQKKCTALALAAYVLKTKTIPGNKEMSEAIFNGEAPSLPYSETINLLSNTHNKDSAMYEFAVSSHAHNRVMATKFHDGTTNVLSTLVNTGSLFTLPPFQPDTPRADMVLKDYNLTEQGLFQNVEGLITYQFD